MLSFINFGVVFSYLSYFIILSFQYFINFGVVFGYVSYFITLCYEGNKV